MASIKTKFTVGLFIAIGLAITIVAIIWLGMSKYLEKGQHYVAYFDESIQGLDKDSPVKYRGVAVGRVESVGMAPDGALIQVVIKIETELEPEAEKEVMGDIVAQLKSIGITGIMFLELDRRKESDQVFSPKLTFEPSYPVITTKPSEIQLFLEGVNKVLNQFKSIDGKGFTDIAKATFDKIDRSVDDIQLGEISVDIRATLNQINGIARSAESLINTARGTVQRFDSILAANEKRLDAVVDEVQQLIQNADDTMTRLNQIVGGNEGEVREAISGFNRSIHNLEILLTQGRRLMEQGDSTFFELQPRLLTSMQQLETTIENLKIFSETIAAQPSQLLFGRPPEARPVEPE